MFLVKFYGSNTVLLFCLGSSLEVLHTQWEQKYGAWQIINVEKREEGEADRVIAGLKEGSMRSDLQRFGRSQLVVMKIIWNLWAK